MNTTTTMQEQRDEVIKSEEDYGKTLQGQLDYMLSAAMQEYGTNSNWTGKPQWLDKEFMQVRAFCAMHNISWKFRGWQETIQEVRSGKLGGFNLKKPLHGPSQEYFAGFELLESCYLGTECQRVDRRSGEKEPGVQYCDHGTRATYWSPVPDVECLGRLVMEGREDAYSIWCSETMTIECV